MRGALPVWLPFKGGCKAVDLLGAIKCGLQMLKKA